jgi:ribokinase
MSGVRVLLLGDINLDVAMAVHTYPAPGGDSPADQLTLGAGGAVVNTAVALQRLGIQTALLGCTGDDQWAEQVLSQLQAQVGIDLRGVRRESGAATGMIFVAVTPDGERTMFSYRGANTRLAPEHLLSQRFEGAELLQLSGYALLEPPQRDALWKAVALAEECGVPVSLDTGLDPALSCTEEMRRLIPRLSVCILGLEEAQALFGSRTPDEALDALFAVGRKMRLAAVKLGSRGCVAADVRGRHSLASFPVAVEDTTGAGDAFSAGLLYGWLQGWNADLCGTLANALGALATTVRGGGLALPGRGEALAFLERQDRPGAVHVLRALRG